MKRPMKRPTKEELDAIEERAARVAMEGFMLTLREGLKPYGAEGERGAVLDFFGETLHQHSAVITGTGGGTLLFTYGAEWGPSFRRSQ